MIAYVDSSVLLRVVLGQRGVLMEWKQITTGVASVLVEVECLRTIDRLRYHDQLSDDEIAMRWDAVNRITEQMELAEPASAILRRAAQPLPVPFGTLDAIHLATASVWHELERRISRSRRTIARSRPPLRRAGSALSAWCEETHLYVPPTALAFVAAALGEEVRLPGWKPGAE